MDVQWKPNDSEHAEAPRIQNYNENVILYNVMYYMRTKKSYQANVFSSIQVEPAKKSRLAKFGDIYNIWADFKILRRNHDFFQIF